MANIIRKLRRRFRVNESPRIAPPAQPGNRPYDLEEADFETFNRVKLFTMTSLERVVHLLKAVEYIEINRIPGAIVECGVWKGGSIMAVAMRLCRLGNLTRDLYLYDTFEGMTPPDARDQRHDGAPAASLLASERKTAHSKLWAYAPIDEVKANLASTHYPADRIHYVQGKVEKTIPACIPEAIALLRLDTDWYSSTLHELEHLFPRLSAHGVLIIDDYGYWRGAKRALDEYFARLPFKPLLHRIDATARACVVPGGFSAMCSAHPRHA